MPGLEDMLNKSMFNKGAGKKKKSVTFGKGSFKSIEQAYTKDSSATNNVNGQKGRWEDWYDNDDVEFDED